MYSSHFEVSQPFFNNDAPLEFLKRNMFILNHNYFRTMLITIKPALLATTKDVFSLSSLER